MTIVKWYKNQMSHEQPPVVICSKTEGGVIQKLYPVQRLIEGDDAQRLLQRADFHIVPSTDGITGEERYGIFPYKNGAPDESEEIIHIPCAAYTREGDIALATELLRRTQRKSLILFFS